MMSVKCTICGRPATTFCIRCRRPICNNCLDRTWYLCKECASLKWELEADYHRRLNYIKALYSFIKEKSREEQCKDCIILRELLIDLLKSVKGILYEAEKEGFSEVVSRAKGLESNISQLLLRILVSQGIAIFDQGQSKS